MYDDSCLIVLTVDNHHMTRFSHWRKELQLQDVLWIWDCNHNLQAEGFDINIINENQNITDIDMDGTIEVAKGHC